MPKVRQVKNGGACPLPRVRVFSPLPPPLALSFPKLFKRVSKAVPISTHLQHASPFPNTDRSWRTKNILSAIFSLPFPTIALLVPLGMASLYISHRLSVPTHMPSGAPEFSITQWHERPDILLQGADQFLKPEIPTLISVLFKSPQKSK